MRNVKKESSRKALAVLLAGLVCLCLAACGGPKEAEATLGQFRNEETGRTISLGMTQAQVEEGMTPEETEQAREDKPQDGEAYKAWMAHYGRLEDMVTVMYTQGTDVVEQIAIGSDEIPERGTHWTVDGKAAIGTHRADVIAAYGEPTSTRPGNLTYNYNTAGEVTDGTDTEFILTFDLNASNQVRSIVILKAVDG